MRTESSLLWSGYRKEKGNVSQTTEEKIPWEGEFSLINNVINGQGPQVLQQQPCNAFGPERKGPRERRRDESCLCWSSLATIVISSSFHLQARFTKKKGPCRLGDEERRLLMDREDSYRLPMDQRPCMAFL